MPTGLSAATGGAWLARAAGFFVENRGQVRNGEVRYYLVAGNLRIGMVPSGLLIEMLDLGPETSAGSFPSPSEPVPEDGARDSVVSASLIRVDFEASNRVVPQARGALPSRSNYLVGKDLSRWQVGIPHYREVVYPNLYEGIDLVFQAGEGGLKYDFLVRPGADPGRIRWSYAGATRLELQGGALVVRTTLGEIRDAAPIAAQDGREVPCRYAVQGGSVGLACDAWDPTAALTIDPLIYSTFLGGSQDSRGLAVAVDASGDAYVTGYTASIDFPTTPGAFRTSYAGGAWDAFVVKLNPSGTGLVYATLLGGTSRDRGFAIAVDGAGEAVVAGYTNSTDFPTTPGAFRTAFTSGAMEAFVAKLNAAGSGLLYSTFLGGTTDDRAYAITLDAAGDAFVAGRTKSADFPVTPGAFQTTFKNTVCGLTLCGHGFVSEVSANGSTLVYSSFLGGTYSDRGLGISVDGSGNAYVAGYTNSSDFPVTPGAYGTVFHAGACGSFTCSEAYVAKVNPGGSALVYATFLGGSKTDQALEIAIDAGGSAYVTGETNSTDFPVTSGAYQTRYPGTGSQHAFVAKLDPTGSALAYATFLGGSGTDHGHGIGLDGAGDAYIVGRTNSSDFPTTPGAYDTAFSGGTTNDAFVSELSPAGTSLVYSTFLGGAADDWGNALALDAGANAYVTGHTFSSDFPTTPGAFRTTYSGIAEAFLTKLSLVLAPTVKITSPTSGAVATTSVTVTGTAARATSVQVRIGGGAWTNATGVASWTVTFDLSPFPNGALTIEARAFDGTLESLHDSITIQKVSTGLTLDRCTVSPGVVAIQVGGTQAFAAIGWNGTTEIAGVAASWSVSGNLGTITPAGMLTSTTAGVGSVDASVAYGGRSATCSAGVTVTTGPPPTVAITSPASGSSVTTNVIAIRGISTHADAVQIRAGNGTWSNVAGDVAQWTADLDLSGFPNAQSIPIEARAFNGTIESTHDRIMLLKVLALTVTISYPLDRAQVSGLLTVTGTATEGSTVQVRFDGGAWVNASSSGSNWSYRIDTTATFEGAHLIEARAVWGPGASSIVAREVVVSNPQPTWLGLPPLLWAVAVGIVIVALALLLFLVARRRRRRDEPPAGPGPR